MSNNEKIDNTSCLLCSKSTCEADKDCVKCHKKFHLSCIPHSSTMDKEWKCEICTGSKSEVQAKQKTKSTSGKSSSSKASVRSAVRLQMLEEEKKLQDANLAKEIDLEERQLALQRSKLVRQKAIDEEYLRKKRAAMEDSSSGSSVASERTEDNRSKNKDTRDWVRQQQQNVANLNPQAHPFAPKHLPSATAKPNLEVVAEDPELLPIPQKVTREQLAARSYMGKLPRFSGDAKEWPTFISQFERSTELCGFSADENIVRLQNCITGRALEVVGAMLTMPDSIDEVISTLRKLFGRPERILQNLLESVRSVKTLKADDMKSIIDFSVKVNTICLTIRQGGLTEHLSNPCLVAELVQKLPSMLQMFWSGYKASLVQDDCILLAFNKWLKTYFEIACDLEATNSSEAKVPVKSKSYVNVHVADNPKACIICGESCSSVEECQMFKEYSVDERWERAKEKRLCFRCLKKHGYRFCSEKKLCKINNCDKKHHQLLHEEPKGEPKVNLVAEVNVHSSDLKTLFRVLPVKLYNNERCTEVLAFIDEGSSTTLIDSEILSMIGAKGDVTPLPEVDG